MESFPEKRIKTEDSDSYINNNDNKRKKTLNFDLKKEISLKKRSNSTNISKHKNKNFAKKYNFDYYSMKNKIKKMKTFLVKDNEENNFMKEIIKNSNLKKDVTYNKNKNTIKFNDNVITVNKNRIKKHNSLDNELAVPLKSNGFQKEDFEVISLCGKGAYGTVLQVKYIKQNLELDSKKKIKDKKKQIEKIYAIKIIDIDSIQRVNKLYQIYLESQTLNELDNPLIVKIYGTFQYKSKVYMVLEFLSKGDFGSFLKMNYPLKEETIKFYAAEIVLFLEYLQKQKIVHRDLKPENIMLNDKNHIQVIDFATARKIGYYYDKKEMKFREDNYDLENDDEDIKGEKVMINPDEDDDDDDEENDKEKECRNIKILPTRNKTFVGTAEYVSPEVIDDQRAGYGADLWAFGIILYQMFCGQTPFKGRTAYLTFKNIEKLEISFPNNISMSENAKDLIRRILIKDPSKRLGAGDPKTELDLEHLKNHPFFKGVKWKKIISQNVPNEKTFKFKSNKIVTKKINEKIKQEDKKDKNDDNNNNINNIIILKKGLLSKKSFWFHYNERFVILDSTPRIIYKDSEKGIVKGIIPLNKKCKVYASRQDIFILNTPKDEFKFKSKNNDVPLWINEIKECIKKYGKDE